MRLCFFVVLLAAAANVYLLAWVHTTSIKCEGIHIPLRAIQHEVIRYDDLLLAVGAAYTVSIAPWLA